MLFLLVHLFVGSAVAGTALIVALVLGLDTLWPLAGAAALGALVSIPVSLFVVRRMGGDV